MGGFSWWRGFELGCEMRLEFYGANRTTFQERGVEAASPSSSKQLRCFSPTLLKAVQECPASWRWVSPSSHCTLTSAGMWLNFVCRNNITDRGREESRDIRSAMYSFFIIKKTNLHFHICRYYTVLQYPFRWDDPGWIQGLRTAKSELVGKLLDVTTCW